MPTEHRNDHGTTRKPVSRSHRKTDRTMNHNRSKEPVGENHHTYKSGHSSVPKTKKYPGLSSHEAGDSWENPSYYGHELAQTSKSDIAESAKSGSNPEKHGEEVSREITSKRRHHKIDSGKKKTFSSRISGEHKKEITHIKVKIPGDSGMMERRESTERMIKRPTDNRNDSNLCSHNLRPNDEEEVTSTAKASAETENAKKCIERMDKTLAANEGENKLRCVSDDLAKENDIKSRSKECFKVSLTHEVEGENSCSLNSNDERKEAYRVSERQDSDYEEYTSDFDEVAPSSSSSRYSDNDMSSKEKYSVCFSNAVESQQPTGRDNSNSPQLIDFNRSLNDSRHRIQQRLKQRASDLRRLIELELDSCISVFDLRPLDEYSNYMLRFGKANRNQVQSQTQDDAIDRDVQTDPIEYCSSGGIWTQWPPLDSGECWGKYDNSSEWDNKRNRFII
ncbi:unnamed protein product [Echinostoma caproni]|uniref:Dentin sialophosphoprotein-like n=1 Tax=Echinostoma caproni TaxID=27848 RepID=A0A183B5A0_9TREM|nr:unnamed protein product [Echinostoma caproni]